MSTPPTLPTEEPAPGPPTSKAPTADATRIAASVDRWKRDLLDLTRRNRALNFRVNKVSTIAVIDEQPAEVFRQLYLRERAMRFKAAPEGKEDSEKPPAAGPEVPDGGDHRNAARADSAASWHDDEEEDDRPLGLDFVPYDPTALGDRHTDDWLQTSSTPEALDKSLRRLDEQARLSIEEQGVNTLFLALGMLHYREVLDSEVTFRAPLVLLPVELSRKTARTGYVVRAAEDEPIVNPALAEMLRRDHGVTLPGLPESSVMPEDYDLQGLLQGVAGTIRDKEGWGVKTDIYLGLFSFQKFVMYKDLEANTEGLRKHRLISQIITRKSEGDEQIFGLPRDIREMDLDRDYPPESTHQVVDADSSQLRAIAASSRNLDLVIEGPPGTGKSQTITNLIATALAAGKSVLFVAEKMAALSVVHDRLVRAHLGEFCLELHSTKANKRAVMKELGASLDASLHSVAAPTVSTQRLPQVRATLSEYARAVHTPHGSLSLTPYKAYGELGKVLAAPRLRFESPVEVVTRNGLEQTVRDLGDLVVASVEVGTPVEHPWRDTGRTFYSENDLVEIGEIATELGTKLDDLAARAATVRDAFGLPPIDTFADVETAASIMIVLARSPGAPLAVLESETWNQPPAEAAVLIERGRELEKLKARLARSFKPDVHEQEHVDDIAYVERKSQGVFSFLKVLDSRYRAIRKRWLTYREAGNHVSLLEQANEMKQVDRLRSERQAMSGLETKGRDLFGGLWSGERSSWDVLEAYVRWVVEFRGVCVRHGLSRKTLEVAVKPAPGIADVKALQGAAVEARKCLERLREAISWPDGYLTNSAFNITAKRARALSDHRGLAPKWAAFEAARQTVAASLGGAFLPLAMNGELAFRDLAPAFLRAFYLKWLTEVLDARPLLQRFHTLTHEERQREFRELDERVLLENRAALVGTLRERLQESLRHPDVAAEMPYLRRELSRQRGLNPLRQTMKQAGHAVRSIKPCVMMSPLTVAQLLDGTAPPFDLVIFDEASQVPPQDAVGAIMRGKQLIVVGDPKQLPPTNFFSVSVGTTVTEFDEAGQPLVEDSESILEVSMGAGIPMSRLKWHYRSAHESLISFSNVQFYEADLYTFPSVETGNETFGLQFEYIREGMYEGKGLNAVEARRVADEVVRFAKGQLERKASGQATQSLGVGTFNLRQQLAILDELEKRRRQDPSIEPFFDRGAVEPFFVKNLENIQGDERDVIFISVTYARGSDGKLRYQFGPLNTENGWRRLNVLTTRARQRMRVFSSMRGDEINAAGTTSRGANLLREFLLFAERGRLESVSASLAAETESPFEQDVLRALTDREFTVVPQVGVAGYRIDFGILDEAMPGRFLCGIECDGAAYHASETARDRDRLRLQVLEARGWVIHRVWSTDWFKDRPGQVERLSRLIEGTRSRARQEKESARQERARVAEEANLRAAEEAEARRREVAELAAVGTTLGTYVRPSASPYSFTPGEGKYSGREIIDEPQGQLVQAVVSVVSTESPIHETDLLARVASLWGTRAGSRIQERIRAACDSAERSRVIERRQAFFWNVAGTCEVRSRTGTHIPADRIAPEEYEKAILAVLATGHGFSRSQLTTEVRSVLGFGRTGGALEEAIGSAIDSLLSQGQIGEASTGIRLRR